MRPVARTSRLGAAVMVSAFVLAACGGTGDDSGESKIVSAAWGDPQKPLELPIRMRREGARLWT